MHHQHVPGAVGRHHPEHPLGDAGVGHAHHLAADARRVRHGPQDVERGRDAQLAPRRAGVAQRGVEARGEAEADAGLLHAAGHRVRAELDGHAELGQQVGRATRRRGRPVAVLAHGHAHGRGHQGGQRRHVDRVAAVATRADDVDHARRQRGGQVHPFGHGQHGVEQARELLDGLALQPERDDEARHLGGRRVAAQHFRHGNARLLPCQVAPLRERTEDRGPTAQVPERRHRAAVRRNGDAAG